MAQGIAASAPFHPTHLFTYNLLSRMIFYEMNI